MIKKIIGWFRKKYSLKPSTPDRLVQIVEMLANTRPEEISCDDVANALAEFTEHHRRGEDVAHLMPLVHHHLEMCPGCREEFEGLMAALDAEEQELV